MCSRYGNSGGVNVRVLEFVDFTRTGGGLAPATRSTIYFIHIARSMRQDLCEEYLLPCRYSASLGCCGEFLSGCS